MYFGQYKGLFLKLIKFFGTMFGSPNRYTSLKMALAMALHVFVFFPVGHILFSLSFDFCSLSLYWVLKIEY